MTPPPPTDRSVNPQHALFGMLHWVRVSGCVMAFAIIAVHLSGKHYSDLVWALLVLQFFVYPHLLRWRTRRAVNPMRTELQNFLIDAFALGLWAAALGYPLWITFAFLACMVISISLYSGLRNATLGMALFLFAGLSWIALTGQAVDLHTGWPATALSIIGVMVFLLMATSTAYQRNVKLRETRKALKLSEQALQARLDEIHALQTKLNEQVNRDPLTGLYNRRYLDSTLTRELARCKREGQSLCLMMIDIDHFKRVNDTYGHPAGDEVLKSLSTLLSEQARTADVACRYGGEEFLMLLPSMPLGIARERAEQWRAAFAASTIVFGEFRIQATLSIGICAFPEHGSSATELIDRADRALYRAKEQGRNRVVVDATEKLELVN